MTYHLPNYYKLSRLLLLVYLLISSTPRLFFDFVLQYFPLISSYNIFHPRVRMNPVVKMNPGGRMNPGVGMSPGVKMSPGVLWLVYIKSHGTPMRGSDITPFITQWWVINWQLSFYTSDRFISWTNIRGYNWSTTPVLFIYPVVKLFIMKLFILIYYYRHQPIIQFLVLSSFIQIFNYSIIQLLRAQLFRCSID